MLQTGPNSAALPLLVEPLLPRSWKLDHSRLLKGDMETDLYSTAVAQEDINERRKRAQVGGCKSVGNL